MIHSFGSSYVMYVYAQSFYVFIAEFAAYLGAGATTNGFDSYEHPERPHVTTVHGR